MKDGATVLVDTGPFVALFDPSEESHGDCKHALAGLRHRRLVTSLAVVTEATHLLGFSPRAQLAFLSFLAAGAVEIADVTAAQVAQAAALMERFADLPMDFADATLVVLAEHLGTMTIFTLDDRDFSIYRVGRRVFRRIPQKR